MSTESIVTDLDELFAQYDLAVEFDERLKQIDARLLGSSADLTIEKLVTDLRDYVPICPLEVLGGSADPNVRAAGHVCGTREQVYEYIYHVRYEGDPALWHLRPMCKPTFDERLEGQIRTCRLTLAFLATSPDEAEEFYREALSQIDLMLRAQNWEIEQFNRSLPAIIRQKVVRYRAGLFVPTAHGTCH